MDKNYPNEIEINETNARLSNSLALKIQSKINNSYSNSDP